MKRLLILSLLFFFGLNSNAQAELNEYKYAMIPLQYDFLKGKDKYRLNTLTRVLFKGEGFGTYFNEEKLPEDLFKDRCLAIYPDVKKISGGFFKTKLQIIIKDCNGRVLLESQIGESNENNYQLAHNMALREAFKSIENLDYTYTPEIKSENAIVIERSAEDEKKELKKKELQSEVVNSEATQITVDTDDIKSETTEVFDAKIIENGFQLFDATQKRVMILLSTAAANVYLVKDRNAVVFKNNDTWIYSENNGSKKIDKLIKIEF